MQKIIRSPTYFCKNMKATIPLFTRVAASFSLILLSKSGYYKVISIICQHVNSPKLRLSFSCSIDKVTAPPVGGNGCNKYYKSKVAFTLARRAGGIPFPPWGEGDAFSLTKLYLAIFLFHCKNELSAPAAGRMVITYGKEQAPN